MDAHADDATGAPHRELTFRSITVALVVAALIAGSYPYVVLKLGYGPNISVVSAFFGYIALSVIGLVVGGRGTRWENNMVQTAGTTAGQAGFMCVVLAAIDMLNQKPELGFSLHLTVLQTFLWLSLAGIVGVLLAVPLRRHFIDEENLTFADGTAAGETLLVLDQGPKEAGPRVTALGIGIGLSALAAWLRDGVKKLPDHISFGPSGEALRMGSEVSLLSFGSGMLVGPRIALSMGLGMLLSWVIAPPMLVSRGIVAEQTFPLVLRWVMWPATGLLVAGGITALLLKWKLVAKTFVNLRTAQVGSTDFPLKWVVTGVIVASLALFLVQWISLGFPLWLSLVSLVLSMILMLVGTRVLGETNWAPISAMANLMQAVFAVLAPGNMAINMIGSGMSGTIAANGEHLMQDYKAGKIVGSSNRNLTIMQLLAVPVGAIAVSLVYPALKAKYGVGGEGLSSPISVKWAGFAELLNQGFSALPAGCFQALLVAVVVGAIITVFEPKHRRFLPSPTGVGIGMLVPGLAVMPMVLGGIAQWAWKKSHPSSEDAFNLPLSSGFIAGEALLVLVFAIIAMTRG
ncbi:MAG: peptide transporter [Candidatus Eisenbacteria bacterium]|uniref:Peptide transporter n=1 Tax=Eiseniibacteriota bacterium TaxID=2212470 RepID=A0A849SCZ1_UNCEI|nr:peptide transporter [Candidatus Eisenbacteria bacterium]